jgi:hypothetical protein
MNLAVVFVSLLLGKRCQHSLNQGKRLCAYLDTDQLPAMSFLLASDVSARAGPALRGTMEEVSLRSGCRRVLQDIGERGEREGVDERGVTLIGGAANGAWELVPDCRSQESHHPHQRESKNIQSTAVRAADCQSQEIASPSATGKKNHNPTPNRRLCAMQNVRFKACNNPLV